MTKPGSEPTHGALCQHDLLQVRVAHHQTVGPVHLLELSVVCSTCQQPMEFLDYAAGTALPPGRLPALCLPVIGADQEAPTAMLARERLQ